MSDCDCGCNTPVATTPKDMLEFLANRFEYAGVSEAVALWYARDIRRILKEHYGATRRAVFYDSSWRWRRVFVTLVEPGESDSEAILRATEMQPNPGNRFYVEEYTGPEK